MTQDVVVRYADADVLNGQTAKHPSGALDGTSLGDAFEINRVASA
jgi:hypothetical protein